MTARRREHGFELDLGDLGHPGPRNDVDDYLATRGWTTTRTPLGALLGEAGPEMAHPVDGRNSLSDNDDSTAIKR